MEINALSCYQPLGDVESWSSQYVKCLGLKELTITTCSDVQLTLSVCFSINGYEDGQTHTFKVHSWQSFNVRVSLPWCKFKLENKSGKPNNSLILSVISNKKIDLEEHNEKKSVERTLSNDTHHQEEKEEGRFKSPLKSILNRRRKSNSHKSLPISSCKVPEHVPRGSLLVGDYNSGIKSIPPPIMGINDVQVLTCIDGKIEWTIFSAQDDDTVNDTMDTMRSSQSVKWRFD